MRVLALIAARGGSKRVPGKNLKLLGGRPLFAWSVSAVAGLPDVCDTLVSTDTEEIADTARSLGAWVPWLRPAELATDTASSVDVCVHALDWYEAARGPVDGLLLLQPTSPFRRHESMKRGFQLFTKSGHRPVIGVSPAASHPMWCYRVEEGADGGEETMRPFVAGAGDLRSQDLPPAYVINGAFYLVAPDQLRTRRSFTSDEAVPLVMEHPAEALDIDTPWDWQVAEAMLSAGGVSDQ
jgi:CMP-N,N'-diacetyllegionaminic acid synthase